MKPICFKVEDAVAAELESRARDQGGGSRNTVARAIVLERLKDAQAFRLLHEIDLLQGQVAELRLLLATAVTALLVQGGKVQDPREAESWVRRTFFGEQIPASDDDTEPEGPQS